MSTDVVGRLQRAESLAREGRAEESYSEVYSALLGAGDARTMPCRFSDTDAEARRGSEDWMCWGVRYYFSRAVGTSNSLLEATRELMARVGIAGAVKTLRPAVAGMEWAPQKLTDCYAQRALGMREESAICVRAFIEERLAEVCEAPTTIWCHQAVLALVSREGLCQYGKDILVDGYFKPNWTDGLLSAGVRLLCEATSGCFRQAGDLESADYVEARCKPVESRGR
jgi:hypothetical protein